MFVELHIIQNFAPANLNRDDTGSPKDCTFGGYRRARISSQCLKRAVRTAFADLALIEPELMAKRTKRLVSEIIGPRLQERLKLEEEAAEQLARAGLAVIGAFTKKRADAEVARRDNLTEYLLYIAPSELEDLVGFCVAHEAGLQAAFADIYGMGGKTAIGSRDAKRKAHDRLRKAVGKDAFDRLRERLDGGRAADLALFGRMLADLPERNVHAASQVAHALSTNEVSVEFDFYTAVDDIRPEDTAGADMLGTVEFNSACFYRYANVDTSQLTRNLGGDAELARKTLDAFLRASVAAVPTGKQNSMAAQNPPSLVMTVTRTHGLWSLANAFLRPVRPGRDGDLVQQSVKALDAYWAKLDGMYGAEESGITNVAVATTEPDGLEVLRDRQVGRVDTLVSGTVAAAFAGNGSGG